MTSLRRERHRLATAAEIKAVARRQMAEHGTAALSLRAIAREMEMTAPAIYRYFPSRDDLVTALIVDAYHDLGRASDAAADPTAPLAERLIRIAIAYRAWAMDHPAEYGLIFGTPIPGYHAPFAVTQPAAIRAGAAMIDVLVAAHGGGERPDSFANTPPAVRQAMVSAWSQLHGFISLELNGQFDALGEDPGALFAREMAALAHRLLAPDPAPAPTLRPPPAGSDG